MQKIIVLLAAVICFNLLSQRAFAQTIGLRVSPRPGVWKLVGLDIEQTAWKASLRLAKNGSFKSILRYRGSFHWRSSAGKSIGREYFTGSFNQANGRLVLKSYAVKSDRESLATGNYVASVSNRGRTLKNGRWFGKNVVKGNWSAKWLKLK